MGSQPTFTTRLRALPIRIRLMVMIVGVCMLAMLLSTTIETAINWNNERRFLIRQLHITAEMLAMQSRAPLEFLDPQAARENLSMLAANPYIRKACLYNESGAEFAQYIAAPQVSGSCMELGEQDDVITLSKLKIFHTVVYDGHRLGTVYLERDLDDINQWLRSKVSYDLAVIAFVLLLAWFYSDRVQDAISRPIMELAGLSRRFSQDRSVLARATKTSDDEIGQLVDAFNEMTEEIRRNELQLRKAIAELTRSNEELDRFAHICSHDLQEPLRMLSNYAVLLENACAGKLQGESVEYLHFITDGAIRMRDLIRDILSYARLGHQTEPLQPVDVNQAVDYALANLRSAISERRAIVHKGELPQVMCSRTLLMQIFQNLIGNAIKFCRKVPEVWIGAARYAEGWEFSVRDNGIGIDPRYGDKIFEIFKRLNRREEFGGTGIGLAIVKKAVEYYGGSVRMESEPGRGTTFLLPFPIKWRKER